MGMGLLGDKRAIPLRPLPSLGKPAVARARHQLSGMQTADPGEPRKAAAELLVPGRAGHLCRAHGGDAATRALGRDGDALRLDDAADPASLWAGGEDKIILSDLSPSSGVQADPMTVNRSRHVAMSLETLASELAHCLIEALERGAEDFRWDKFFRSWFRERGRPYFFLFNQHLGVTNAQYAELFSLIEAHATQHQSGVSNVGLLFHKTDQMKATVADAMNMLLDYSTEERLPAVDAIICDPPYGFNTREEQGDLANLYAEFIGAAVAALRHRGHLIICLPSESYTGRDLPYCTNSGLITNQVLIKAKAVNKRIYVPARSMPSRLISAPYYWESQCPSAALPRYLYFSKFDSPNRPSIVRRRRGVGHHQTEK